MRYFTRPRSIIPLCALAIATAARAESGPRAPTAKWNVEFASAQCIAQRDYGTPASPLKLVLKAPAIGDIMQVAVIRPANRTSAQQVESTVTIEGRRALKTNLLIYSPKDSDRRVYLLNLPSAEFESIRQAKTLSVRSSGLNETFGLSQMGPLLDVMDQCVADLRQVYNISTTGGEPAALKTRAKANLASFFGNDDYPDIAGVRGQSGRVEFALLIGEDGRVADCTIVATSGVPSLDSQACAVLKTRARFKPARGLDGMPAKDSVVGAVVWQMPS